MIPGALPVAAAGNIDRQINDKFNAKYGVDDITYWEENVDSILKCLKYIIFIGLIFITAGIGEYTLRDLPFEEDPGDIVKGAIISIKSRQEQEQIETI